MAKTNRDVKGGEQDESCEHTALSAWGLSSSLFEQRLEALAKAS